MALLLGIFIGAAGSAEASRRPLLTGIRDNTVAEVLLRRTETRARRVMVDLAAIAPAEEPAGSETIDVELFPDVAFTATKTNFERRNPRDFTWFGKVTTDPRSVVILVAGEGQVRGSVFAHGKHYGIRGADAASQIAVEIDQSAFPPETCDRMQDAGVPPAGPVSLTDAQSDTGAVIDVLVVYTPAARNAEGGTTAMNNLIALAVAETNTSYGNSGIAPRLNLVHAEEIAYTETGNWTLDLGRLRETSDGFMDGVHAVRDAYMADVVVMLINNALSCGQSYINTNLNETYAFSLVSSDCATIGYYSFGHEIGHLQGARHDLYVDPTISDVILGSPVSYNHGHVSTTYRLRTVMAYDDKCLDAGFTCIREPYWSNPGVNYSSTAVPTGTATRENNALVLNNTAASVANFRQSRKTLTVRSTYPAAGVAITVNPADTRGLGTGTTPFPRMYIPGTVVTLTAPASADGNLFANWTGCPSPSGTSCTLTVSDSTTIVASYTRDTVARPSAFALLSLPTGGQAIIREIDPSTGALQNSVWVYSSAGVGAPWQATSYTRSDALTGYVLWSRGDTGQATLWQIDPATGQKTSGVWLYSAAGVGAGWQASSYFHVDASTGYVLWSRRDTGQATLWQIDPATGQKTSGVWLYSATGVGAGWQATSYAAETVPPQL